MKALTLLFVLALSVVARAATDPKLDILNRGPGMSGPTSVWVGTHPVFANVGSNPLNYSQWIATLNTELDNLYHGPGFSGPIDTWISSHPITPDGAPTPTPTPPPPPPPPPPPTGITPTLPPAVLPAGYTLKFNQDFTQASYSPFNVPANVSLTGPPGSIWRADVGTPGGMTTQFNGEGDPFSTAQVNPVTGKHYLTIHANGGANPPYGGMLSSSAKSFNAPPNSIVPGFWATNGYWEVKAFVPAQGSERWMSAWVIGSTASIAANNRYGEVDMLEFPTCQQNLHSYPVDPITHKVTANENPYTFNPTVPSVGWHVWGCLIQPGVVSIYIDGVLSHQFTGLTTEWSVPMQLNLDNSFGTGLPQTGNAGWTNDFGIEYARCWAQ